MLYLLYVLLMCWGGGWVMIFSFDKSTSLEGGGKKKKPWDDHGGFQKRKNKEIIIAHPLVSFAAAFRMSRMTIAWHKKKTVAKETAHPLDILWMLPYCISVSKVVPMGVLLSLKMALRSRWKKSVLGPQVNRILFFCFKGSECYF